MPRGQIARAQDAVFLVDEGENFLLVEPVIAGGDAIDAEREHFVGDAARDAETAREIFAIDDDEIELQHIAQARQFRRHHLAARFADNVADEKNTHAQLSNTAAGRASVDEPSPGAGRAHHGEGLDFLAGIGNADGARARTSQCRQRAVVDSRRHSRCDGPSYRRPATAPAGLAAARAANRARFGNADRRRFASRLPARQDETTSAAPFAATRGNANVLPVAPPDASRSRCGSASPGSADIAADQRCSAGFQVTARAWRCQSAAKSGIAAASAARVCAGFVEVRFGEHLFHGGRCASLHSLPGHESLKWTGPPPPLDVGSSRACKCRWAPYVRNHGLGQGQLPVSTIKAPGHRSPDARGSTRPPTKPRRVQGARQCPRAAWRRLPGVRRRSLRLGRAFPRFGVRSGRSPISLLRASSRASASK